MNLRRWLAGLNVLVTLGLLVALFVLVNFVGGRRYARADVTRTKLTALSDKTTQVLKQLHEPVQVVVFYQPTQPLYELVRDLLMEYERLSPSLSVEYVDPEQDVARAKALAQELNIDRLNLVVFRNAAPSGAKRQKFLSDTDLAEYDYASANMGGQPTLKSFKGEEAFTSALLAVTQTTQPLVWLTTGHGEHGADDPDSGGLEALKLALEQENLRAQPMNLLEQSEIPADVRLVILAGPTRRLTEQELLILEGFLERGGRVLALIDPLQNTGLDGVLARWGVELGNDIVVDPARQLPFVSAANLFVISYGAHPIVQRMQAGELMTLFPLARSVRPLKNPPTNVTELALTSERGWGETETEQRPFSFSESQDVRGPVSIAVAVEPAAPPKDAAQPAPARLVVIGDSDFVTNTQLSNVGNLDFAMSAVHWLIGQEQLISISPKALESLKVSLTGGQLLGIFWLSIAGIPLLFGALGGAMWWVRRR